MKKLLLFCVATAAVVMTGCEGTCHIYYEINNETNSEIVVQIKETGENSQIIIMPDSKQLIDSTGGLCDYGGLPEDGDYGWKGLVISDATMVIGETNIPDKIWMREHWDFSKTAKYEGTYTLTVTDELIETLLSQQNN